MVSLPSEQWYRLRITLDELRPVAADAIDTIINILTRPLTPEEANTQQKTAEEIGPDEITVSADSYDTALEIFNEMFLENTGRLGLARPTSWSCDRSASTWERMSSISFRCRPRPWANVSHSSGWLLIFR